MPNGMEFFAISAFKFLLITTIWTVIDEGEGDTDEKLIPLMAMLIVSMIVSVVAKAILLAKHLV